MSLSDKYQVSHTRDAMPIIRRVSGGGGGGGARVGGRGGEGGAE